MPYVLGDKMYTLVCKSTTNSTYNAAVSNYTALTYIPAAIYMTALTADILSNIEVVDDISLLRQVIGL